MMVPTTVQEELSCERTEDGRGPETLGRPSIDYFSSGAEARSPTTTPNQIIELDHQSPH